MDVHDIYALAAAAQAEGEDQAIAIVISTTGSVPRHAGSKMLVKPDGSFMGTVGGGMLESEVIEAALRVIQQGKPELVSYAMNDMSAGDVGICGGTVEVYVEPVLPPPTVLVVGCGHVGKEVAALAKWIGFRVLVTDDREDLCTAEHIPDADGYYPVPSADVAAKVPITTQTYIAAMTRGQIVDIDLLPGLLQSSARYIGLIGSRRRWTLTASTLRDKGIPEEQLKRINAPVGLELQAETPREIAVSIMAEIIMKQHGGDGQPMQWLVDKDK